MIEAQDPAAGGNPAPEAPEPQAPDIPVPGDPEWGKGHHPLIARALKRTRLGEEAFQRKRAAAEARAAESASDTEAEWNDTPDDRPQSQEDREGSIPALETDLIAAADERGGILAPKRKVKVFMDEQPCLPDPAREPALARPAAAPQTLPPAAVALEEELAAIVSECRFLMREVSFHSARLTPDADDRIRFLDSACRLATTGAAVGDTVARLRAAALPAAQMSRSVFHEVQQSAGVLPQTEGGGS